MASRTLELILALKTQNLEAAKQLSDLLAAAQKSAQAFGAANEQAGQQVSASATKSAASLAQNEAAITKLTSTFKGSQQAATTLTQAFDGNAVQAQKVYQAYIQLTKAGADSATVNARLQQQFGASTAQVDAAAKSYSEYGQTTQKAALNVLTLTDKIQAIAGTTSAAQGGLNSLISSTKVFTGQNEGVRQFQLEFNRVTNAIAGAVTTAVQLQPAIQGIQQGYAAFKGAVDIVVQVGEAQKVAKTATEGTAAATTVLTGAQGGLATAAGVANTAIAAQAAAAALIIGAVVAVAAVFDSLQRGTAASREAYEGLDRIRDIQIQAKLATGKFNSSLEGQEAVIKNISKTQGFFANSFDAVIKGIQAVVGDTVVATNAQAAYQDQLSRSRINVESYSKLNLEFAEIQNKVNKGQAVSRIEIEALGNTLKEQLVLVQKQTVSTKQESDEKDALIARIEGQIAVTRQLDRAILKTGEAAKFSEKQFKEYLGTKEAELAKVVAAVESSAVLEKGITAELVRNNVLTVEQGAEQVLKIELEANAKKLAAIEASEAEIRAAIALRTTNANDPETLKKLADFEKQKADLRVNGEKLAGDLVLLERKNGLAAIQQELKRGEITENEAAERTLAFRIKKNEEDLVNVINLFANKKITEEQYNTAVKNLADQRLEIVQDESQKRVQIAQKALADENKAASTAIKQAEVDNQAAILDLKTRGYDNEGQLRAKALEDARAKAESELAIERDKFAQLEALFAANPTNDPAEQTKRTQQLGDLQVSIGEKTNALGAVRLQQLTETYRVAIDELGVREQILANISKLLDSQNAVTQASLAYQKAELDAALSTQNIRVSGLKEALTIQQSILTEEEKKAQTERDTANKAQIDQNLRILGQERLNQLGIEGGASREAIAVRLAQAEQEQLALKARAFEANQIAEQAALQIAQQKRLIEIESLNLTAQKIQLEAEASGRTDLVARAQQLVNLTQEQIANLGKVNQFETEILALKQNSERVAFNENQLQADYNNRQALVKAGVQDIGAAGRIAAEDISGIPTQIGSASDAAKILNKDVAETVDKFLATRKASTETFGGITIDVTAAAKAIGDKFAEAFTGLKAQFGELPGLSKGAFEGLKTTAAEAGIVTKALGLDLDNVKVGFTNTGAAAVDGFGKATDSAKAVIGATNELAGNIDKSTKAFQDGAQQIGVAQKDVVGYIDLVIERADGSTFAFKQIPQGFDEAANGIGQTLDSIQEQFKSTNEGIVLEFANTGEQAKGSIEGIADGFPLIDQAISLTTDAIPPKFDQAGAIAGDAFSSKVGDSLSGITPKAQVVGDDIENILTDVADLVSGEFDKVFDQIARQSAAAEAKAKAAADSAKRALEKQVNPNGFVGDPAKDRFNNAGSAGGNIGDYLRNSAAPKEGFGTGTIFKDKGGSILSPEQVARDAIKNFGDTAEAVSKITGVVGDLAYQATVIANRVEKDYRDNGISGSQIPPRFGDAFADLRGRASGGEVFAPIALAKGGRTKSTVIPQVYEVNEQGQESYTNYATGKTSLIQGGRQFTTFPSDGFVNNANDTAQMKSEGLFEGRALGGGTSSDTAVKAPENPLLSKEFESIQRILNNRKAQKAQDSSVIGFENAKFGNEERSYQAYGAMVLKALAAADAAVKNGDRAQLDQIIKPLADFIKPSAGSVSGAIIPQEIRDLYSMFNLAVSNASNSIPRATGGSVLGANLGRNLESPSNRNPEVSNSEQEFAKLNPEIKRSNEVFTEQTAIVKKKNEEDAIAQKRQAELNTGLKETSASLSSASSGFGGLERSASQTSAGFSDLSASASASISSFGSLSGSASQAGSGLGSLASSAATGAGGVDGLGRSAQQTGSSFDSVVPAIGSTVSNLGTLDQKVASSGAGLDGFSKQIDSTKQFLISFSSDLVNTKSGSGASSIPKFATGGSFNITPNKNNSFIAGERGQELITLDGKGGARIYNNADTQSMLGLPGFAEGGTFSGESASGQSAEDRVRLGVIDRALTQYQGTLAQIRQTIQNAGLSFSAEFFTSANTGLKDIAANPTRVGAIVKDLSSRFSGESAIQNVIRLLGGASQGFQQLRVEGRSLKDSIQAERDFNRINAGESVSSPQSTFSQFATGGTFQAKPTPSNSFIAGEQGAELITLDGRGGARIYNAGQTQGMLKDYKGYATGGNFISGVSTVGNSSVRLPTVSSLGQASQGIDNKQVVDRLDQLIKVMSGSTPATTTEISGDINFVNKTDRPSDLIMDLLKTQVRSI
jgi:hypothetical protein